MIRRTPSTASSRVIAGTSIRPTGACPPVIATASL